MTQTIAAQYDANPNTDVELSTLIKPAVDALKNGLPVAIPTETVYGLAANALSFDAVQRIFTVKGRPSDNPLIVHISSLQMLPQLLDESYTAEKLYSTQDIMALIPSVYHSAINKHWPGPLSILLQTSRRVPSNVTAGLATIAVRFPKHPIALKVIEMCGFPLAAPSANSSGRPSPTLARHVLRDLEGKIPYIIDGGVCDSGVESTVLDGLGPYPIILRPGGVTYEDLCGLEGMQGLRVYQKNDDLVLESVPTTPGMKYAHYKPNADVYLVESASSFQAHCDLEIVRSEFAFCRDCTVGAMGSKTFNEFIRNAIHPCVVQSIEYSDNTAYAKGLFDGFRSMEGENTIIFVEAVSEEQQGAAIMNRLKKAATSTIIIE